MLNDNEAIHIQKWGEPAGTSPAQVWASGIPPEENGYFKYLKKES